MVKFQHSLFALPWAFAGAVYAAGGVPSGHHLLWILVAMVSARTAAMTFNRIADAKIDAENPRTRDRAIPRGLVSRGFAAALTVVMIAVFAFAAWKLNDLCLKLVPVALVVLLGYSYTKRFTPLCHWVLGLSLAMAPVGAWLAIKPVEPLPLLLGAAVVFWIAGADILYACEDVEFDRRMGLRSIPASFGIPGAFWVARGSHLVTLGALAAAGIVAKLGVVYWAGSVAVALLLVYEHAIVKPHDLRKVNRAFFHVNVAVGFLVFLGAAGDLWNRMRLDRPRTPAVQERAPEPRIPSFTGRWSSDDGSTTFVEMTLLERDRQIFGWGTHFSCFMTYRFFVLGSRDGSRLNLWFSRLDDGRPCQLNYQSDGEGFALFPFARYGSAFGRLNRLGH